MNLIIMTLALSAFGNTTNQSKLNQTYQVVLEQFNSSNCSHSFYNYSFLFNCSQDTNSTECCLGEYDKLNTSFGSMHCNQYEENNTYLTFDCHLYSSSKSNKLSPYVMAGIAVGSALILIILIATCIGCLRWCNRSRYDRI